MNVAPFLLDQHESLKNGTRESLENKMMELKIAALKKHQQNDNATKITEKVIKGDDAEILYLLVCHYKPAVIFEIGTWIGTSAMIMVEAINSRGQIITCDTTDCYSLDDTYNEFVSRNFTSSEETLKKLPKEKIFDFVFIDGELSFTTLRELKPRLKKNAIIVTHDYKLPAEKGVLNVVRAQLGMLFKYELTRPHSLRKKFPDTSIAILTPSKSFPILQALYILTVGIVALFTKLIRKLQLKMTNIVKS